jgi:hypothetical protein
MLYIQLFGLIIAFLYCICVNISAIVKVDLGCIPNNVDIKDSAHECQITWMSFGTRNQMSQAEYST